MSDFDWVMRGNVVDADAIVMDGWLAVRDGKIAARGRGEAPSSKERIDARGQWIIPGVVDGQVHSGSQRDQEGLGWASRAAAAGGVTVMVDMPYDDPEPVASRAQLDAKIAEVERDCHVDVALFGTLNETHGLDAAAGLIDGGVCAFKFSTFEATPGRFPRVEEDMLYEAFRRIAPSGIVCGVHNQMQDLTRKNIARLTEADDTGWDAFLRAHPPLIENLATALIYEIGAETGARAHAVHVSTSRGFEICNMYRQAGHRASIETCVQYLMLNHEEHTRRFGARTKHYPPIRPKAEVDLLWTHMAAGDCTFVSSDHVSWGLERKGNPNVFRNSSGGPGLETLLPAFWTGCEEHGISPTMVVKQLCRNPARHFLLDDRKGSLEVGADADVVILRPERYAYDPSTSLSAVQWSSFEGREFTVRVAGTWCRGQQVYDGAGIVNRKGDGRFLRPRKA
ncbi:amidohydrolase family protein [Pandoraea fibrosis]|uniref:Amidohydrolase family protein n=1 Tax=Pandoraea fibrosis TaxID=1891094 RepID=A0ABX6HR37_9BURK|nr:amidohydrolase family protein [Pandoraea fibrosis]QHE93071.1 amidohydrolase family protein [Pandoraea fibrosis]QHF13370.1 amidohydrolase family protein [Pandoraea fibrosis]